MAKDTGGVKRGDIIVITTPGGFIEMLAGIPPKNPRIDYGKKLLNSDMDFSTS